MAKREFDIILYGASGYTAAFVIKELETLPCKVAVSARDISKVGETVLPKISCSLTEISSLTSRTKILLNCVGPYTLTGEKVIQACLETGTHYLDICGETSFIHEMFLKYHAVAKEKSIRIVHSCGFDSLPADLGTFLLGSMHDIKQVDVCHVFENGDINSTTWQSLLLSLRAGGKKEKSKSRNKQISPEYRYNEDTKSYDAKFHGTDPYILKRSCEYFKLKGLTDTRFTCYFNVGGLFSLIKYFFCASLLVFLVKFNFFYNLMVRYPWLFSFGLVKNRPPVEKNEKAKFWVILKGKSSMKGGDKKLVISGVNPGYRSTASFLVQAAMCLLEDLDKTPAGSYTPAVVLHKTRIVDRLVSRGIEFSYSNN